MRGKVLIPRRHTVKYGGRAVCLHYVLAEVLRKRQNVHDGERNKSKVKHKRLGNRDEEMPGLLSLLLWLILALSIRFQGIVGKS